MNSSDIAKVCHEANRALCAVLGEKIPNPWDDCSAQFKIPTIKGVEIVLNKPHVTESEIHESWCDDKKLQGYRFGEQKDDTLKTHPNLVEWEKLPQNQKLKDSLFISIVNSLK